MTKSEIKKLQNLNAFLADGQAVGHFRHGFCLIDKNSGVMLFAADTITELRRHVYAEFNTREKNSVCRIPSLPA